MHWTIAFCMTPSQGDWSLAALVGTIGNDCQEVGAVCQHRARILALMVAVAPVLPGMPFAHAYAFKTFRN